MEDDPTICLYSFLVRIDKLARVNEFSDIESLPPQQFSLLVGA